MLRQVATPPFVVTLSTFATVLLPRRTRIRTRTPAGCAEPLATCTATTRWPATKRFVTVATRRGGLGVATVAAGVVAAGACATGVVGAPPVPPPPDPPPVPPPEDGSAVTVSVCVPVAPPSSMAVTTGAPAAVSL